MLFSIEISINEDWISPIYDHVHHGRILSLFERAREGLVASIGFPNDQLLRDGKFIVVTNADVAYRREVKLGTVLVTCDTVECQDRVIKIRQRVINQRGKTAVEGVVSLMFMDMQTKRGVSPPAEFIAALTGKLT